MTSEADKRSRNAATKGEKILTYLCLLILQLCLVLKPPLCLYNERDKIASSMMFLVLASLSGVYQAQWFAKLLPELQTKSLNCVMCLVATFNNWSDSIVFLTEIAVNTEGSEKREKYIHQHGTTAQRSKPLIPKSASEKLTLVALESVEEDTVAEKDVTSENYPNAPQSITNGNYAARSM